MRVHIAVCDVETELELEVEDAQSFSQEIASAFEDGTPILWYDDSRGRKVGIPVNKIAFVTIEAESPVSVGFG